MPPEEYSNLTVHEDVIALLAQVQVEYNCDSYPEAVETAAKVALEPEPADLARLLADRLEE